MADALHPPERAGTPTPGPLRVRGPDDFGMWCVTAPDGATVALFNRQADARAYTVAPAMAEAVRVLAEVADLLDQARRMDARAPAARRARIAEAIERAHAALAHPAVVAALAALKGVG